MADEEEAGEHARERCSLLRTLKHTVENLLTMDLGDKLDTSDCLKRMISDLQSIMKHGQREQEAAHKVDDEGMDTNISLIEETESMLQQALLGHCLSLYLLDLMNNARQISYWYQEYAFLRSAPHVEAMFTCIQAFEKGDRQLLTQIDSVLLNKRKYDVELWLSGSEDLDSQNDIQGTVIDELSSSPIQVVYSDSTSSEREDFVSSYGSPGDALVNVTEYSPDCNAGADKENDFQLSSSEAGQKFSYSPRNITDLTTDNKGSGKSHGLALAGLRTTEPSRIAQNVKATLAHAVLSAVLESDEVKPASWFDSQSEDKFYRIRKASSTGSLNDNFIHFQNDVVDGNTVFENSNSYKPGLQPTGGSSSELSGRKAFGHCRSKSDQVGVPKFQELGINKPKKSEQTQQNSSIGVTQLSSSLPTSESLYSSDPYLENPYEEQSLAEMLASQDFSSCELDKENAHFSISEALIAAIEQMKCDDFNTSEEEDDEEICHLKKELERKRREKKQGRHEKEQLAFSDETTQSTTSEPSTATTSSKSACESEDELSHDWEEISPSDKQLQQYNNEFCMSTTTLVSTEDNSSAEAKNSSQLSAETVAKCLLQKFANRSHPAASELQWLVSFQDAPQSLLPLPKTVAVAPDDVPQVDSLKRNNSVSRQNSLPCRIRGNAEWAPPRAQIIFHAHKPPRRKTLMSQQNFRCAGCGMAVAPDYIKRFRYCHYLGKYFCSSCHSNFLEVIPANVIRKWDFTRYEVSNFAKDLLQRIHCDPLFDVKDLNPSLYKRFRVLEELKDIRQQLHFFKTFMQTCRKANELAEEYSKLPDHICGDLHLYSMQDLLQARDGDLLLFLRGLAIKSLNHINQCQLCLAKGFICEYCKNGDDIIFPFELTRVVQCSGCRASFHKECFVAGKCPKCERIRIRKQSLSKPVSSEEDDSSGSWLR